MIVNEQVFWLVVGLFYLSKQVRFLDRLEACAFVNLTGRLKVALPHPFETVLGVLAILNPCVPFRVTVRGWWGMLPLNPSWDLERDWSMLVDLTRKLTGIRIIATLAWLVLFVLGPVLTSQYGLGRTLLAIAPLWVVIYGTLVHQVAFGALASVGAEPNRALMLFECLVCPGYVPALPAILTHHVRLSVDIGQLAKRYQGPADWARLQALIERRIADAVDEDPGRDAEMDRYRVLVLK